MSEDELNSAILYEAKSNLPFDISEVALDYARVSQEIESDRMQILLVAAKHELIADATEPLRWAGGRPTLLEASHSPCRPCSWKPDTWKATRRSLLCRSVFNPPMSPCLRTVSTSRSAAAHGSKTYIEQLIRELGVTFERAASILAKTHRTEEEKLALEKIAQFVADKMADQLERSMPSISGAALIVAWEAYSCAAEALIFPRWKARCATSSVRRSRSSIHSVTLRSIGKAWTRP